MIFSGTKIARGAVALLLAAFVSGCVPAGNSADEEKDPHFLEGKSRVSSMDYSGAIESYERALQVNPHSSAAHFELGSLYYQREQDPAAAIYHYGQYLKYHPTGTKADLARRCIVACKQDLAAGISLAPVARNLQKELEQTQDENKKLKEELEKWRAYYKVTSGAVPSNASAESAQKPSVQVNQTSNSKLQSSNLPAGAISVPAAKTYTVRAGDTPAAIAKKCGVRVDALMSANPRVDARHLRPGQSLVIPVQ